MTTKPSIEVALTRCFFCGEPDRIVMNTRLTPKSAENVRAAHEKVIDLEPCAKCAEFMQQGVILLPFDPAKSENGWEKDPIPNPYRTGGFYVVKDEAVRRIFTGEPCEWALKSRWIFIEKEAADRIG